jgi:hypothetical protein
MMALTSVVSAVLMEGQSEEFGVVVVIGVLLLGLLIGAINGAVVVITRVPDIVVTLAMSFVWAGIALLILKTPGGGSAVWLKDLVTGSFLNEWIPKASVVLIVVVALIWIPLRRSRLGLSIYAIGSHRLAAFRSGVPVTRTRITAYALTGLFSALGGLSLTASTGIATPVPGPYTAPGQADLAVWRPSSGVWYAKSYATGQILTAHLGSAGDTPVPADYDGDGRTDFAVWTPSTGIWRVRFSSTPSSTWFPWSLSRRWGEGALGDVPVPGDYDRDGRADFAIWRESTATWWISYNTGSQLFTTTVQQWGAPGDKPFFGARRLAPPSLGIWRPSTSIRYDLTPWANVLFPPTGIWIDWGPSGTDKLVAADFAPRCAGASVALFNSTSAQWRIQGYGTTTFGQTDDWAVPANYAGTRNADLAVWRPADGTWHIRPNQIC